MLHLNYYPFDLAFEYPFTISKGTKTHQPTLIVSLGLGSLTGYGEATAIQYYKVSVEGMIEVLQANKNSIERYALTDPQRFWHFLHHLIPGENFLTAALDIAAWDLFAKMRRMPLYKLLRLNWQNIPMTDYTIGYDDEEKMVEKLKAKPWPVYKIKIKNAADVQIIETLRKHTTSKFRLDANEALTFDEAKRLLPEFHKLGVDLIEQPLARTEFDAMKELKQLSPIPLFADESCQTREDVKNCIDAFHGINIKLAKCGGITPAIQMIGEAKKAGLKLMMGSMSEATIGAAAVAHFLPLLDEVDMDGPLLLKEDVAEGLQYHNGIVSITNQPGLGIRFAGQKFRKQNG
jgi:L-Ala-D/L-Glu epimerase